MLNRRLLVCVFSLFCLCGCGDGLERIQIEGILKNQGQPLDNTVLQFMPQEGTAGQGAIGMSDAQGKFTVVSSVKDDPGIPPGKYRVRLSRLVNVDGKPLPEGAVEAEYPGAKESIPAPYNSDKSPIEVSIEKSGTVDVDLPAKLNMKKK